MEDGKLVFVVSPYSCEMLKPESEGMVGWYAGEIEFLSERQLVQAKHKFLKDQMNSLEAATETR